MYEVGVIIPTSGRKEPLAAAIESFDLAWSGPEPRRLIVDDSNDRGFAPWLEKTFPNWHVKSHGGRNRGFGQAIDTAW